MCNVCGVKITNRDGREAASMIGSYRHLKDLKQQIEYYSSDACDDFDEKLNPQLQGEMDQLRLDYGDDIFFTVVKILELERSLRWSKERIEDADEGEDFL